MPIFSLHESGFGPVCLHTSIKDYPFLKPAVTAGATKDFYFFPEERYYYTFDVSNLDTDIPGFVKGIFVATNKQNEIIKISFYIADDKDGLKQYLIDKFGSRYSFMEAGADQIGFHVHHFWTTSINSSIYYLPQKHDVRFLFETLSVVELSSWSDTDLLDDYSIHTAF